MPDKSFELELELATSVAREAGALILSFRDRLGPIREKAPNELVTRADEAAQELIVERLTQAFPDDEVVAEEGTDLDDIGPSRGRRWVIDPLDGTTNFAHGLPPYCVSIALADSEGELVVGVVYEIAMGETYTAVRGGGARLDGIPIRVTGTQRLSDALVTTGFPFREFWYADEYLAVLRRFMFETRGVRRPGSAAADLAYVASGRCDLFFEAGLAPWDVAAGIVLVREAGGEVSGLKPGIDPLYGGQILAANPALHAIAHEFVQSLGEIHFSGPDRANDEADSADNHSKANR